MADPSKKLPDINFAALAAALLGRAVDLVTDWLPGGTVRGDEYVCGSLSGGKGESCSVNLTTGRWADFAGDDRDRGGDLISLYAAIKMIDMGQAALQLARSEGLEHGSKGLGTATGDEGLEIGNAETCRSQFCVELFFRLALELVRTG
jgi:hypothetical protein